MYLDVGFGVFTAVVMKSIIFWGVTPCSLLRCNRRFGGTYRLHLQGRRKFQRKPASKQVASSIYMLELFSTQCHNFEWCAGRKMEDSPSTVIAEFSQTGETNYRFSLCYEMCLIAVAVGPAHSLAVV
jgi:hypothetical protein